MPDRGGQVPRLRAMVTRGARAIGELIREGERSFSFEFFPPKDEAGEEQLWKAISELEPYRPTFVSVTYGAGGSSRDTTAPGDRADRPGDLDASDGPPHLRRPHQG